MATTETITASPNFDLHIDACPFAEWAAGRDDGMLVVLWEIQDRAEFLRLLAALDHSRAAFLVELQSVRFVKDAGVSTMPLGEFSDLMFGRGAGGVHGHYAEGYASAFASLRSFLEAVH